MAVTLGRVQNATYGGTAVGRIVTGTFTADSAEVNVSTHDSGQWEEFLQGRGNATVELDCLYDEADAGQLACIAAYFAQTTGAIVFQMAGTGVGTKKKNSGTAFVKAVPQTAPNDQAGDLKLSFRLTSTVTFATQ